MGSTLNAQCPCGYEGSATVASGRRDHGKVFYYPHCCEDCKAVVSIDILKPEQSCPTCGGSSLTRYGVAIKELPYGRWERFKAWLNGDYKRHAQLTQTYKFKSDATYCYRTHTTYVLPVEPSMCPVCKKDSLSFRPGVLFD